MKGIEHPSLKLFQKEKYLGRGGFGHVWKVLFTKGDYYLAMKQISKIEISKKRFISNIFSERDILNYIYNNHIVNLYATFQDEYYLYMIMDYLEGGDLRKHMKEKIFNLKEIRFVAACIIIGLEFLHKKGIIHRDIKPENLIFDEKGFLRISDFGIAIRDNIISEIEKNNDKSGTPGYMAPERIINNRDINYSYSSDFFSLGVILYELIMLKKPFRRNIDKIGNVQYTLFEDVIQDLFNNEAINLTPTLIKEYRNKHNNDTKNINWNSEELVNLCDLINKLLIYEQKNRLGYNNIDNIKKHPFFGERFEWKKIYHRSVRSPFNIYEFYKKQKNDNNLMDNNISKYDKINFSSDEERINFQNKFKNFTLIHKITKEDCNYFYLNEETSVSISKYKKDSYINKYRDSNKRNIKKTLTTISKKNNFLSQIKKQKKDTNDSNEKKIMPYKLFKENNNNHININKNIHSNLLKIINSTPKKSKIPAEIIEKNFMNNFLNRTNLNFYKLKNNINKNNYLPLINSDRQYAKTLKKPISAFLFKKRTYSSIDNCKKSTDILIGKNPFKDHYINLIMNKKEKNKIKIKNERYFTDSNNNLKKSRKLYEHSNIIKNNGDIINDDYRDKIIKLNNNNIDRLIKQIFIH